MSELSGKKGDLRIAAIIAGYNEAKMIGKVVRGLPDRIEGIGTLDAVVIDDGSVDSTSEEALKAGAIVLRHLINRGQGAALKTGFDYAVQQDYDAVVTYDADGQHRADEIPHLLAPLIEGADIALGSRFMGTRAINMPVGRKFVLKVGVVFTRLLSRVPITDTHNGFRAISISALKRMKLIQDRMEHASEIIDQVGKQKLKFVEVPVTIEYSDYSKIKGQGNAAAFKIAGKMIMQKILG